MTLEVLLWDLKGFVPSSIKVTTGYHFHIFRTGRSRVVAWRSTIADDLNLQVGMAILPRLALTRPAPPPPARVFPAPQRWWGGDGAIFCPRTPRRGKDEFSIFIPAPPRPRLALIMTIIVNLVNPKSLIFKVKHKILDKIFFILNLLLLPLTLLPSLLSIHVFQF